MVADILLSPGETSLVTITFTEAVQGFTNSDLTVEGGTLSDVSSSDGGTTWTAVFTPAVNFTDSSNRITLANTGVRDAAGNPGVGTTVSNNFAVDTSVPELAPVQALNGVNNLDVKSALVINFNQNIELGSGKIVVHDNMGANGWTIRNTSSKESVQDVYDNDVEITLSNGAITQLRIGGVDKSAEMAGSVRVSGTQLIIDPAGPDSASNTDWDFDWDFGANYHISLDAGVIKSLSSGLVNAQIDGSSSLAFSTVTPADAVDGAASRAMTEGGALEAGYTYHNAHVSEISATPVALNFSSGKHALVMQDAGSYEPDPKYRVTTIGGYVSLSGFGSDDLFYMENMGKVDLPTGEGTRGGQWNTDLELNQRFRSLGNIDNGLEQRVLLPDYNQNWVVVTNFRGADIFFEDANHWNANVVIYA